VTRVHVDLDRCTGHGRCYEIAPEIFDEDEAGCCLLRASELAPELVEQARRAEGNCPEGAIRVEAG
jgi:ferredoxin